MVGEGFLRKCTLCLLLCSSVEPHHAADNITLHQDQYLFSRPWWKRTTVLDQAVAHRLPWNFDNKVELTQLLLLTLCMSTRMTSYGALRLSETLVIALFHKIMLHMDMFWLFWVIPRRFPFTGHLISATLFQGDLKHTVKFTDSALETTVEACPMLNKAKKTGSRLAVLHWLCSSFFMDSNLQGTFTETVSLLKVLITTSLTTSRIREVLLHFKWGHHDTGSPECSGFHWPHFSLCIVDLSRRHHPAIYGTLEILNILS